ncbi:hypothetical protein HYPSUDRAFT_200707 [Hypholoma sublateritium FD-334 SS-4]|uniref:Uncharacterized protein n=1 Tax=Hypholoma sublateritium (strain FD-334 SS-4) TaxID=945553 RepID=A0A0D2LAH6_HYPSF|nr:hypothetical protein HYPSUDRAFT_200707 [Hypholoma sublateritium FD-334 SS-4]
MSHANEFSCLPSRPDYLAARRPDSSHPVRAAGTDRALFQGTRSAVAPSRRGPEQYLYGEHVGCAVNARDRNHSRSAEGVLTTLRRRREGTATCLELPCVLRVLGMLSNPTSGMRMSTSAAYKWLARMQAGAHQHHTQGLSPAQRLRDPCRSPGLIWSL